MCASPSIKRSTSVRTLRAPRCRSIRTTDTTSSDPRPTSQSGYRCTTSTSTAAVCGSCPASIGGTLQHRMTDDGFFVCDVDPNDAHPIPVDATTSSCSRPSLRTRPPATSQLECGRHTSFRTYPTAPASATAQPARAGHAIRSTARRSCLPPLASRPRAVTTSVRGVSSERRSRTAGGTRDRQVVTSPHRAGEGLRPQEARRSIPSTRRTPRGRLGRPYGYSRTSTPAVVRTPSARTLLASRGRTRIDWGPSRGACRCPWATGAPGVLDRGDRRLGPPGWSVPHQHERPAGTQHASELRNRELMVEPVERFGDEHGIDRCIRYGQRLGGARQQCHTRTEGGEPRAHVWIWFDRNDFRELIDEDAVSFPGPGSDFQHRRRRGEPRNTDCVRGIARPSSCVVLVPPRGHLVPVLHGLARATSLEHDPERTPVHGARLPYRARMDERIWAVVRPRLVCRVGMI